MSTLDTLPGVIEVGTNEIATYNYDATAILGTGESVQSNPAPTAQILTIANYSPIANAFIGAPGVSGNLIQVNINGPALQLKQSYYLIISYNTTPSKRLECRTTINTIV